MSSVLLQIRRSTNTFLVLGRVYSTHNWTESTCSRSPFCNFVCFLNWAQNVQYMHCFFLIRLAIFSSEFVVLGINLPKTHAIACFDSGENFKDIDWPFGGGGGVESILIRSLLLNWRLGYFFYLILKGLLHKIIKITVDAA
jgi:hypothetical protein